MQVIFFVFVFTLFGGALTAPSNEWYDSRSSSYSDFDDDFPFGYTGAVASTGYTGGAGAYAGSWPSYPYPFFNPFPWAFGWQPVKPIIPWYRGDNVCIEKKTVNMPDDVQSWLTQSDNNERKAVSCHGNSTVYICEKRQGSTIELTKYKCCSGCVPSKDGCVKESSDGNAAPAGAPTPVRKEFHSSTGEKYSYSFSDSNSDTTRGSNVEKVAPQ